MDGIHDLGGMENFGPIPVEADEPVFHHDWEARVMGMRMAMGFWGKWTLDGGRHSVERLPPADYLGLTYYEKWLASLVNLAVGTGLVSIEEIRSGRPDPESDKKTPAATPEKMMAVITRGRPTLRDIAAAPKFAVGDKVRTAAHMHSGHTRLPRYARDKVGAVILHHGPHVFADTQAKLAGEHPQHLYTVRFAARDLWGDEAANHSVTVDLWESYLAAA